MGAHVNLTVDENIDDTLEIFDKGGEWTIKGHDVVREDQYYAR